MKNKNMNLIMGVIIPLIAKLVDVIWDNIREDSRTVRDLEGRIEQLESQVEKKRRG